MASGARGLQHAVDVLYDSEMGLAEGGNCTGARELTAFFGRNPKPAEPARASWNLLLHLWLRRGENPAVTFGK